jgi:SPP1 family predicted phage head-tail adaptor
MSEKITLGKLRERITIQSRALSNDGQGGHTKTWSDVDEVWAKIEPKAYQTFFKDQLQHRVTHHIIIRYDSSITLTGDMRLKHGADRYFYVKSFFLKGERNRWWVIETEEGTGVQS